MPLKGKNSENFQTSSGAIANTRRGKGRRSLWKGGNDPLLGIFTGLEGILIFYIYMQK